MTKKTKLKDLIVNDKSDEKIDKSAFSEKLKKVVFDIISSINPVKDDTKKPKDVSKALHTKLSSKQKTNIRRGDSVADILARIFHSMNESRLEMIKSSELKRNFEDEHIKERKLTKKRMTYKKHRLKKDKFNLTGLLTMGLIVNFGDIVKWATSLAEPFTEFIDNIKSEFQNFDINEKTEQLAAIISPFISDMKTSLLQGIDNFLNTWVDELLSWIEKSSGFIKFNRENIPRSNLSGSGYRTPESDKKTADMVKDKESGMPDAEFNKKYNITGVPETIPKANQTSGKMSSATVTPETEKKMNEKRSTGDRIENAFNSTASAIGTVAKGVAGVVGHIAGTAVHRVADDVGSMFTQTGKDVSSTQIYKDITGTEQTIKPTNPIVDRINASEITPLTTPSVQFNKNQTKNNDLNAKPKPTISTSTTPAKNVNMGGSQSSVSPGNPAVCRNVDKTLSHISSGNTCKV